jgi:hypothetical protein
MRTAPLILFGVLVLCGCQTTPRAQLYFPPGDARALRIEIVQHDATPTRYELQVDGEFVVEMDAQNFGEPRAATTHKGRRIEVRSIPTRGGQLMIGVFVDGAAAANFSFRS